MQSTGLHVPRPPDVRYMQVLRLPHSPCHSDSSSRIHSSSWCLCRKPSRSWSCCQPRPSLSGTAPRHRLAHKGLQLNCLRLGTWLKSGASRRCTWRGRQQVARGIAGGHEIDWGSGLACQAGHGLLTEQDAVQQFNCYTALDGRHA